VTKPLDGIRVVDLTRMIVGPTATMLLADMGADVVKIEPPAGDDVRYMQTSYDPEYCPFFLAVNRNKRGVVLDLTSPEGPVRTYEQVHADPQLAAIGTFLPLDHEVAGRTEVVNAPFRIGHVPVSVERTPPTLGRDTVEVLREVGYDDADIKALEAKGVTTPAFLDEE